MSRADLFPDAHADGTTERVAAWWDLDYPLPMPRKVMCCPMCGWDALVVKDWKFHKRTNSGSKAPWRCDVRLKCIECSHVPIFGIPIPKAMWDHAFARYCSANQWVNWRKGKQILAESGYFD